MIAMCLETADQSERTAAILDFINYIFIGIFLLESIIRLFALNWRYFTIPWNIFDISIVVLSLFGKNNFS